MQEKETNKQESEFDSDLTPEQQKRIKDVFSIPPSTQLAEAKNKPLAPIKFARMMARSFNNVKRK